ncbi:MAG TPA: sporulation integral membrane protein YlbJ [Ruminiclostridium sp.]
MNIFLILCFIILATTLYLNNKKSIIIYIKKCFLPLFCIMFIIALIAYPKTAVESAYKGIHLWLDIVFPSLFPFFVASQLLSKSGFINIFGIILEPIMRPLFNVPGCGSFALAMGIVSGYPVGAVITTDLRKQKLITRVEAERLLTFTNNSGPLFIMGAVAVGMFNLPKAGYLLYFSHIAACITVGLIFKYYKRKESNNLLKATTKMSQRIKIELKRVRNSDVNPWSLFGECIKNSIFTILTIGGFIIFFSVLINIMITSGMIGLAGNLIPGFLSKFGLEPKTIEGLLCGMFEITTGANLINLAPADLKIKLCCASLIIGWAGFSVHTQVLSIVSSSDIRVKPYIIGKALQGIISAFYTYIGYSLFNKSLMSESPVFANISMKYVNQWGNIFKTSLQNVVIASLIMLIISISYIWFINILSKKRLL